VINRSHTARPVEEGLLMYAMPLFYAARTLQDNNYPSAGDIRALPRRRRRFRLTRIRARRLPSGTSRVAVGNSPC